MIITDIKELKIQHDEPLHLLRVEWAAGRDMRRLRPALEQLSQVAIRLQITHGLLAIDTLPDISAYDQIWLGSQWLPKTERLALKQAVIVLSSGKIYNQQAIETLLTLNRNHVRFDFQFFSQSVSAMHWLTNESRRLPALLAEWDEAFGPMAPEAYQASEPRAPYRRP
ncbi:hypothetical protein FNT36_07640 [Hymenobacter setariae]|uniref:STAS/SEC14 domain-containing protein n=1 Tax=Hymenobacter setariae TaxID=2594794 RepID=A0A558BXS9_9BACT|nr:hypothetical protein [Hymenobacter setariae]TVT41319.1 hypothetical protein FNT36_07640 [Hymenobacter setariae]